MTDFKIGDMVFAEGWCYGEIIDICDNEAMVEFDTGFGGGTWTFDLSELVSANDI